MTMPIVESLQKEYADTMVLLAINIQETRDDVRDYIRAQGIRSRVLLDEEGLVAQTYGAEGIPLQILIDKQGTVRFVQAGYGPGMASRYRAEINKLR
jgi:thiol-disulfide isomerase/thioredoxin